MGSCYTPAPPRKIRSIPILLAPGMRYRETSGTRKNVIIIPCIKEFPKDLIGVITFPFLMKNHTQGGDELCECISDNST